MLFKKLFLRTLGERSCLNKHSVYVGTGLDLPTSHACHVRDVRQRGLGGGAKWGLGGGPSGDLEEAETR